MAFTISKDMIVSEIARDTTYSKRIVSEVLDSLLASITVHLSKGRRVQLFGFGTFEMQKRNKRTGRNPHTGKPVPIPARIVPHFEAGEVLKRTVIKET